MYDYTSALLAIEEPFKTIKQVMQQELMAKCITAKQEDVAGIQAQYALLEQIDLLIQNSKETY